MDYKKFLNRVAIGFVGLLVFLTFFSRTLLDLSVPRVSIAFIDRGNIHPQAMSNGIVTPLDTERIFAPASGRITQILQRGDETGRDTVLFTISSDLQTLQNSLEQVQHELRVNALNIEQTISNRAEAQRRLNQLQDQPLDLPNAPTLNLWELDIQLDANAASIESTESDIATLEILYTQGIIPRQDITSREADLARLIQAREEIYTRREQAIANYETAVANHTDSIAATRRARTEQIEAQQNVITGHNFTLSSQNIERERIEARIVNLQEQIEGGGMVYVQLEADTNRIVTETAPGVDIGSMVVEGAPILTTAIRNNNFVIQAAFPQSQDFISVGQDVDITVGTNQFSGTTTRIVPDGARNLVYISVSSSQLSGGELGSVTVSGGNTNHPNIIPLSALRRDGQDYHIMYIVPYERRLGSDYIVYQMQVEVARRDDRNAAITARFGVLPEGPIIVNSDMPISSRQRVRLVAGHEFAPTR